ncbi:MAG: LysR substrate-binding domain-containing protein, partial [Firmicutes bacterium]|nr:LysR substrate-binding domain-containing protein [Bacillota bacterium]
AFREHDLKFERLFIARPHVFVGADNPLAGRASVSLDDLAPFPRLSYEQGEHNSFYFSEEILSTLESKKDIMVRDRATLFNLLIGLNGYTICSGVINEKLNGPDIVAVPLDAEDEYMEIGYLTHKRVIPGRFASLYIEALKKFTTPAAGPV